MSHSNEMMIKLVSTPLSPLNLSQYRVIMRLYLAILINEEMKTSHPVEVALSLIVLYFRALDVGSPSYSFSPSPGFLLPSSVKSSS